MYMVDALEAGVVTEVGDTRVHAVRMTLQGPVALCGAGPIGGGVPGRFAESDHHACYACLAAAMPLQRPTG
jgi:hypothetical protein